jgi:5'-phosphate synthase pdxT subunit
MPKKDVGVLAVQGDFDKHLESLGRCGVVGRLVRTVEDLQGVDRLILPGGESSTTGLLLERYGLGAAIKERALAGMAVWGTCMGMILLASEVESRHQFTLDLLDITVRRNAFGAQVHSFETQINFAGLDHPILAVFIRAPIVTRVGENIEEMARYEDKVVAVRKGRLLGTSFHPELTDDSSLHEHFLSQ